MKTTWNCYYCYSRGIKGGGAITESTTSGGAYSSTTPSGGGATSGPSSRNTTVTSTQSVIIQSESSKVQTSNPGLYGPLGDQWLLGDWMDFGGEHNHGIPNGTLLKKADDSTVAFAQSGGHAHGRDVAHRHDVTIPAHTHGVNTAAHSHDMSHTHVIQDHTHNYSIPNHKHEIKLPDHTHEIEYGIFKGPTPTAVTIRVDGNVVPGLGLSENDVDIIPYLSKDDCGKIVRGWHEVEFIPNDLARVEASLHIQLFMQSRGGGDY